MKTPELLPPPKTMYRALVNRDSSFEGIFFVGVRTTGIFCRSTCATCAEARAWMKRKTEAASNRTAVFAKRSRKFSASRRQQQKAAPRWSRNELKLRSAQ